MSQGKVEKWLTSEGLTLLAGWAREGLTDKQISTNMKIARSTLNEWKKKYPNISDTLKKNKEIVDYEVENALLKRAKGFKEVVTKQRVTKDGDVVDTFEEVYYPPDTGAAMAWLKNRQPKKWRDKPQDISDEDNEGVVIVNDLPKFEK